MCLDLHFYWFFWLVLLSLSNYALSDYECAMLILRPSIKVLVTLTVTMESINLCIIAGLLTIPEYHILSKV